MESKDYDHTRNVTLLFFLDRLLERNEPRSMHDLSCQFGIKGFTKEMRQIVGGSQAGLRKFFQQFPSLFTLDGDYVTVTNYNVGIHNPNDPTAKLGKRDYEKEAVEYFSEKMGQYGPGTAVPIWSALGHRSQASPEIRHVSGQHPMQFVDFLKRHPEDFIVTEDSVLLKKFENVAPNPFKEIELPKIDPVITSKVMQYCIQVILKGPTIIETLFNGVVNIFPEDIWSQVCRTSSDLATFLKIHSDTFNVQSNMVRLVNPNLTNDNKTVLSTKNDIITSHNEEQTSISYNGNQYNSFEDYSQSNDSLVMDYDQYSLNNITNDISKMCNNKTSSKPTSPLKQNAQPNQQTLKARVNSLLQKTLADNSERDRLTSNTSRESSEYTTARLLRNTRVITTVRDTRQIVNSILDAQQPVSFDAEGINLGPSGPMTLLQIGLPSGYIYIFDLQAERSIMYEGGLKILLESPQIIKVSHDCRSDSGALFHQFNVKLANVFDTQVAHAVLQQQKTGRAVHKVKNVSLNSLCNAYNAPINPKKDQMKSIYRRDQRFWSRRPLTDDMIAYAAYDVAALVPTIYQVIRRQLEPSLYTLLADLCCEQVEALIEPEVVRQRKRDRKMSCEVAELRQKVAGAVHGGVRGVVLSNREIRLLGYLDLTEEESEKLGGWHKVAKKLKRLQNNKKDEQTDGTGEKNDDEDDDEDDDYDDDFSSEFPSLGSIGSSGGSGSASVASGSAAILTSNSLTESMSLVEAVLGDTNLPRLDKIDRLEAILAAATRDNDGDISVSDTTPLQGQIAIEPTRCCECHCHGNVRVNAQSQTLSTGDIVITKVFFPDSETTANP